MDFGKCLPEVEKQTYKLKVENIRYDLRRDHQHPVELPDILRRIRMDMIGMVKVHSDDEDIHGQKIQGIELVAPCMVLE